MVDLIIIFMVLEYVDLVIASIFEYINLIKSSGVNDWRFEEVRVHDWRSVGLPLVDHLRYEDGEDARYQFQIRRGERSLRPRARIGVRVERNILSIFIGCRF